MCAVLWTDDRLPALMAYRFASSSQLAAPKPSRQREMFPESALLESQPQVDITLPYRILFAQNGEWRLLFFVRLAIELLIAGSQAADGAGFQLFASGSKKQIPIIYEPATIRLSFLTARVRSALIGGSVSYKYKDCHHDAERIRRGHPTSHQPPLRDSARTVGGTGVTA